MAHYYTKNAEKAYTYTNADGKELPTDIRRARKCGLVPSVSTVIQDVLANKQLGEWFVEQAIETAFDDIVARDGRLLPTDKDTWMDLVQRKYKEKTSVASSLGTEIHSAIEDLLKGREVKEEHKPYVLPAVEAIKGVEVWSVEKTFATDSYGGCIDVIGVANLIPCVIDWKSKKTKQGVKATPWKTNQLQIAAYCAAVFDRTQEYTAANVFISTTEVGRVDVYWYGKDELEELYAEYAHLLAYWKSDKQLT